MKKALPTPADQRKQQLQALMPEVFTEGKIDWEKLQKALGRDIDFQDERYGLSWAGKSSVYNMIQTHQKDTLAPCKKGSINFDSTRHIFIEGENLEVLKILAKSYYERIKMIYIDPPYNTGNDFIYSDALRKTSGITGCAQVKSMGMGTKMRKTASLKIVKRMVTTTPTGLA